MFVVVPGRQHKKLTMGNSGARSVRPSLQLRSDGDPHRQHCAMSEVEGRRARARSAGWQARRPSGNQESRFRVHQIERMDSNSGCKRQSTSGECALKFHPGVDTCVQNTYPVIFEQQRVMVRRGHKSVHCGSSLVTPSAGVPYVTH